MDDILAPVSGAVLKERFERGVLVRLPSGNLFRVRAVTFEMLLRLPKIPQPLIRAACVALGVEPEADQIRTSEMVLADLLGSVESVNIITTLALVEPRVVRTGEVNGPGQTELRWIEWEDRQQLVNALYKPLRDLQAMFPLSPENLEPVHDGENDSPNTEPDGTAARMGR